MQSMQDLDKYVADNKLSKADPIVAKLYESADAVLKDQKMSDGDFMESKFGKQCRDLPVTRINSALRTDITFHNKRDYMSINNESAEANNESGGRRDRKSVV